jgi:hypothetical protein
MLVALVFLVAWSSGRVALAATTDSWTDGTGNWSTAANWTNALNTHTVPANGDTVSIGPFSDGVARTITYDYTGAAVTLNSLGIDLTGAGAAAASLSMPANNLTSSFEYVGFNGRGIFNQDGGNNTIPANGGYLALGYNLASASGDYNLTGGTLTSSASEYVGFSGTGNFTQSGGSNTTRGVSPLYVGLDSNATGTYTLTGGTTTLNAGDSLFVGFDTNSTGNFSLGGSGSLIAFNEYVGHAGTGNFVQTGGTNAIAASYFLTVGETSGSHGSYTLSGTGVLTADPENIGQNGAGTFSQTGGSHSASNLTVGLFAGSSGEYSLDGAGTLNVSTQESIGNSGSGTFEQSGGSNTVPTLHVGYGTGFGVYQQSGGSTTVSTSLQVGGDSTAGVAASYILEGGTVTAASVVIGPTTGNSGFYYMDVVGAGRLTVTNAIQVRHGTLYLEDGGTISAGSLDLGGVPTAFQWSGGSLILIGQEFVIDPGFTFGNSVVFSGSQSLTVPFQDAYVGKFGVGKFVQSGTGAVTIGSVGTPRKLLIGSSGGSGELDIQSPSTSLRVNGAAYVGGTADGPDGTGAFNISSGTVTITNVLKLWGNGSLNLSGGTLNVGIFDLSASNGFHWTGGNVNLLDGSLFGPSLLFIPAGGALSGSGTVFASLSLNGNLSLLKSFDNLSVHGDITGPGSVALAANTTLTANAIRVNALVNAGLFRLRASADGGGLSQLSSLTLTGAGKFDLNDNGLTLPYTGASPAATIRSYLVKGFNGGAWDGNGLASLAAHNDPSSRTALGYNDTGRTIVIKYTYYGDNNLDGVVNTTDFQMFLNGLATNGSTWSQGDYTYDGKVDIGNDFNLFLISYLKQGGALGHLAPIVLLDSALSTSQKSALLAVVPEPSGLAAGAAILLIGSVRRRSWKCAVR